MEHSQTSLCCLNPTKLTELLKMKCSPWKVPQERLRRGQSQFVQVPCGEARGRVSSACRRVGGQGGRAVGHFSGPRAVACQTQHPGEDTDIPAGTISHLEMQRQDQSRGLGQTRAPPLKTTPPPPRSAHSAPGEETTCTALAAEPRGRPSRGGEQPRYRPAHLPGR